MRRSNGRKPQPPRHGVVRVASMKVSHAKKHLQMLTESAAEVHSYSGYESTADSRGAFASGAAGANYETTSVNDTPDADFGGTLR